MNSFWKHLFFVRKCVLCDTVLLDADDDTVFCEDCEREYRKLCRDVCPSCGKPERKCRCVPRKLRGTVSFSAHLFAFYDELSRRIIYSFKLKNYPHLQRFLARELSDLILDVTDGDLSGITLTFVPRKPGSIRVYGFDQSKILAELVSQQLGLPLAEVFRHSHFSKLQKKLRTKEREINAEKSYFLREDFIRRTDKLMILDDVMTTGSTLSALVSFSKAIGFSEVSVVCVAKTGRT